MTITSLECICNQCFHSIAIIMDLGLVIIAGLADFHHKTAYQTRKRNEPPVESVLLSVE
jgi:hypothetical protein